MKTLVFMLLKVNILSLKLITCNCERLIYGFIAKDETVRKLQGSPPGTFLLRFSESDIKNSKKADICGCLTLAVHEKDPQSPGTLLLLILRLSYAFLFDANSGLLLGRCRVYHVKEHLTAKDIHERGLATTLEAFEVKDVDNGNKRQLLTYLYPNREFQQTFNKYILQKRQSFLPNEMIHYRLRDLF